MQGWPFYLRLVHCQFKGCLASFCHLFFPVLNPNRIHPDQMLDPNPVSDQGILCLSKCLGFKWLIIKSCSPTKSSKRQFVSFTKHQMKGSRVWWQFSPIIPSFLQQISCHRPVYRAVLVTNHKTIHTGCRLSKSSIKAWLLRVSIIVCQYCWI